MADVHHQRQLEHRDIFPYRQCQLPNCSERTLIIQLRYWVETKGLSLEEIDEIFEGKKPDHVHLGPDTTIGRLEMAKGDKGADDSVIVLEAK